ncbi:MAG: hypothetical protein M0T85_01150, partial [Dehalococcoidales bacterium]|nr:hypothetical protein [Dehalococcoidales bacterium]
NGEIVELDQYKVVVADIVDPAAPMRHDSKKLAQSIMRVYYDGAQAFNGRLSRSKEKAESVTA